MSTLRQIRKVVREEIQKPPRRKSLREASVLSPAMRGKFAMRDAIMNSMIGGVEDYLAESAEVHGITIIDITFNRLDTIITYQFDIDRTQKVYHVTFNQRDLAAGLKFA